MPVAVAVALLALHACSANDGEPSERTTATADAAREVTFSAQQVEHGGVRWSQVDVAAMASSIQLPGQLLPDDDETARLGAPAEGRVITVHVRIGDRVTRGQPLVTLQSQAASAARADFDKATAELDSRRAAAVYARSAKDRAERLLAAKAIARQDVERARADAELADAALSQAETELARARAALGQLGVTSVSGEMVLRSPVAGVVLSRDAVPGTVVEAGTPLVAVADPRTLWLEVAASDVVASSLRTGSRVRFTVPPYPADTFDARVQSVGGALDPTTRTLPVRATVRNIEGRLRPQMFATAWIESRGAISAVTVPDSAVQLLDQRPVVFVAHPDPSGGARFERRDVELGARFGGRTQVLRGIQPGDTVVVAGAFAVKSEFSRSKMAAE